jgi:hypothetical protein
MANYQQLSDGRPDGCQIGVDATEKVALYGKVPVVQPSIATVVGATTVTAVVTYLTALQGALVDLGIISLSS